MQCLSKGGNLTSSISDHFLQFSQIDLFDNHSYNSHKNNRYKRNWRIFNNREFEDELSKINWNDISNPRLSTDESFTIFYNKIEKLLDEMAPYKKLSKKDIGLQNRPWITNGFLVSMKK